MADTEQQPQVCETPVAEPQEETKPSESEETKETSEEQCEQQEKDEVAEGTCDKEEMDSKNDTEETNGNGDEKEPALGDKRRSQSDEQSNDNDVTPAKKAKENTEQEDNVAAKKVENISDSTEAKEVATAEA